MLGQPLKVVELCICDAILGHHPAAGFFLVGEKSSLNCSQEHRQQSPLCGGTLYLFADPEGIVELVDHFPQSRPRFLGRGATRIQVVR